MFAFKKAFCRRRKIVSFWRSFNTIEDRSYLLFYSPLSVPIELWDEVGEEVREYDEREAAEQMKQTNSEQKTA